MNEEKRDLAKDLEICEAATPGPWGIVAANSEGPYLIKMPYPKGGLWYGIRQVAWKNDAEFISAAREGWPEAIKRAMVAEEKTRAGLLLAEVMRDFVEDGYIIVDEELANALKVFFPDAEFPFVKEDE